MTTAEKTEKAQTQYQATYNSKTPREVWCGVLHTSIEEAIVHAESNLGMRGKPAEPYWGRTRFNDTIVAGWQSNDRKRYRLDFEPQFAEKNQQAAHWSGTPHLKGTRGVHVNEENFDDPKNQAGARICHPTEASLQWADTFWNKWTRRWRQR